MVSGSVAARHGSRASEGVFCSQHSTPPSVQAVRPRSLGGSRRCSACARRGGERRGCAVRRADVVQHEFVGPLALHVHVCLHARVIHGHA